MASDEELEARLFLIKEEVALLGGDQSEITAAILEDDELLGRIYELDLRFYKPANRLQRYMTESDYDAETDF